MTQAKTIDGKAKAAELSADISAATAALVASRNVKPGLAVVIIGEDPASQVYVRTKSVRLRPVASTLSSILSPKMCHRRKYLR